MRDPSLPHDHLSSVKSRALQIVVSRISTLGDRWATRLVKSSPLFRAQESNHTPQKDGLDSQFMAAVTVFSSSPGNATKLRWGHTGPGLANVLIRRIFGHRREWTLGVNYEEVETETWVMWASIRPGILRLNSGPKPHEGKSEHAPKGLLAYSSAVPASWAWGQIPLKWGEYHPQGSEAHQVEITRCGQWHKPCVAWHILL